MSDTISLEPEDVYAILLNKLENVTKKFEDTVKEAENVQKNQSCNDFSANSLTQEQLSDFKKRALEMMKQDSQNISSIEEDCLDSYLEAKVKQSLREQIARQNAAISNMEEELAAVRRLRTSICDRAEDLAASLKNNLEQQKHQNANIENERKRRKEAIEAKHKEMVRAVRAVTAFAFPGGNKIVQQFLGTLLDQWFQPDPYVPEDESWSSLVEFFLLTGMVTRHPEDEKLLRLVDFM